jgi:hypothetical protein
MLMVYDISGLGLFSTEQDHEAISQPSFTIVYLS